METSARNTFTGKVTEAKFNKVMCEIVIKTDAGFELVALITNQSRQKLGLSEGKEATALIKATFVLLEKADKPSMTSARNAFPGKVTKITSDDVMTEVQGQLGDGTPVCALVTTGSFQKLGIKDGDSFIYMFKATSVVVS